MRRKWNKKPVVLAAAALVLTASAFADDAMAYFTTYSSATGSVTMDLGFTETVPEEEVDAEGKHVRIANVGDYDCFVRVKIFSVIEVGYEPSEGWTQGSDGYWYYEPVLAAGETTPELLITYELPDASEEGGTDEFDIIVVQECTPVVYDEAGNPIPDWDNVIISEGTE